MGQNLLQTRADSSSSAITPKPSDDAIIDFYFDFISPYGWLGAELIGDLASKHNRHICWHPFLLSVTVLDTMGLPAPLETPLKGTYLLNDTMRTLRYHGLSPSKNSRFAFPSVMAARTTLWFRDTFPEKTEALVLALYRAHWSKGYDISTPETVLGIIESFGVSIKAAKKALTDPALKQALRAETENAVKSGVFGSPTMIIDGEMFWGSDRFAMADKWLETGGW